MKQIEALIDEFVQVKKEADRLKKKSDDLNKKIKDEMVSLGLDSYETDSAVISYVIAKRETLNEDKLLNVAREFNLKKIIKKKEYVDMNILESELYNHNISDDAIQAIAKCRQTKEIPTLRVKEK